MKWDHKVLTAPLRDMEEKASSIAVCMRRFRRGGIQPTDLRKSLKPILDAM